MARLKIAVVGAGISGLSAAWLLSKRHEVVLFEREARRGGHANTVMVQAPDGPVAVDTGFIVYNEACYPNLTALFRHLGVATAPSQMSLAVSLNGGRYEYAGTTLFQLLGGGQNLLDAGHWRLMADIARFFRSAETAAAGLSGGTTLREFIAAEGYSESFLRRHLLPMAGAIWSCRPEDMLDYPAAALIRFYVNHGLLKFVRRPQWRTVAGGSQSYVARLIADGGFTVRSGTGVRAVRPAGGGALVHTVDGAAEPFDAVVIATHADEALALIPPSLRAGYDLLQAFRYAENRAVLHRDATLMPRRRRLWSSWNCLAQGDGREGMGVTYWMNALQPLTTATNLFVSLNPLREPQPGACLGEFVYSHPLFSTATLHAQEQLWQLQGRNSLWFCGAHFGAGFHEDGLQAGLAVAEQLGGVMRPWTVAAPSGRIHLGPPAAEGRRFLEAAE